MKSVRNYFFRFLIAFVAASAITLGFALFFNRGEPIFGTGIVESIFKYSILCCQIPSLVAAAVFRENRLGMILLA